MTSELVFWYRNHRGEERYRRVLPLSICFGTSEWHKESQWLLRAIDLDRDVIRWFAMRDIKSVVGECNLVLDDAG